MLNRFAPDDIVQEKFKLPSFNHVLLQRKDTKMYQIIFFIVTYLRTHLYPPSSTCKLGSPICCTHFLLLLHTKCLICNTQLC